MFDRLSPYAPYALAALRIITALLFIQHGTQKLIGFPTGMGPVPLMSLFGAAAIIEIATGALVLLGLFTRPAAFVASGMMAVGYFMVHAPQSFFPAVNMGDAAVLFTFVFFYIAFAGPGAWALDGNRAATLSPARA